MEKQARMVLLSTSVILAALLFWSWKNRPPEAEQVQAGTASVQDIYNSVTISGTVEAADRHRMQSSRRSMRQWAIW